jgi:tetratricopeptide (TPR) repeat protein
MYFNCINALRALFLIYSADLIASEPSETVQSVGKIRASADTAFTNGDIDQALKLWNKVIELEPKNENNFYRRFRVYLRQQKYKEALSDLNSALSLKSNDPTILNQRVKLQIKMGKCKEAEADFIKLKRCFNL